MENTTWYKKLVGNKEMNQIEIQVDEGIFEHYVFIFTFVWVATCIFWCAWCCENLSALLQWDTMQSNQSTDILISSHSQWDMVPESLPDHGNPSD